MTESDLKYLEEMEKRLDKKIDIAFDRTRSDVVNQATKTALLHLQEDFNKKVDELKSLITCNTIQHEDMEVLRKIATAYDGVDTLGKVVSWLGKFILSIGIIAGAIIAFVKLGLK